MYQLRAGNMTLEQQREWDMLVLGAERYRRAAELGRRHFERRLAGLDLEHDDDVEVDHG